MEDDAEKCTTPCLHHKDSVKTDILNSVVKDKSPNLKIFKNENAECNKRFIKKETDFDEFRQNSNTTCMIDQHNLQNNGEVLVEDQNNKTFSSSIHAIDEVNGATNENTNSSQISECSSKDNNLSNLTLQEVQEQFNNSTMIQCANEETYSAISEESVDAITLKQRQNHVFNQDTRNASSCLEDEMTMRIKENGSNSLDTNHTSGKVQSLSSKTDNYSSKEKSVQLNQEMQDLMHKNLEKFSPEKKSKLIVQKNDVQCNENSDFVKSDLPQRINPFNHNCDVDNEVRSDVWSMHNLSNPSSSKSPPDLYECQGNLNTKPHSYSYNVQVGEKEDSKNHSTQHISENVNPKFHLMSPSYRVHPVEKDFTCSEDIDAIVREEKSKISQSNSDPWVKIEPTRNITPSKDQSDFNEKNCVDGKKQSKTPSPPSTSLVRPLIEAAGPFDPAELIDGIVFATYYLGSTQLQSEKNPGKNARMLQAQEAVNRIKAPEGESQPSVEVDLLISTDKVKILNADTQETIMDHTLRSISYIADIGKLLVIMAKRRSPSSDNQEQEQILRDPKPQRSYRVICHVFSSPDAQLMAQAIGQSFNVAYQQFLSANGIEPQTLTRDDYNQLLDMQEMYHDDLVHYSKQENVKDIWVEKNKGELLGVVIVESGWGSIVPTVILANLQHGGPAERCGKLSIGDQLMTVNGTSLVGLPLTTCQSIIKGLRTQTIARLHIVSCPPVVTVLIKRPDLKYQLGFSVQDGIICSLMRGGIAERGGVRVGHRIIEINNQSVVATPHEKIVQMLVSSVGEIQMKTMPAMMYRLLTGQEQPVYI